jgi:hypothetical protein
MRYKRKTQELLQDWFKMETQLTKNLCLITVVQNKFRLQVGEGIIVFYTASIELCCPVSLLSTAVYRAVRGKAGGARSELHSPHTKGKVKDMWRYTSIPSYVSMA